MEVLNRPDRDPLMWCGTHDVAASKVSTMKSGSGEPLS